MRKAEKEKYYFMWQTIIDEAGSIPVVCRICGKIKQNCCCAYDLEVLSVPVSETYLKDKFYDESIDWMGYAEGKENNG